MEEKQTRLEEAVNLGGAAVSIAFDVASGNYLRAGVTGVLAFGKYVLIFVAAVFLIIVLTVNMVPIIIGHFLGFENCSRYVAEAVAYDEREIKEIAEIVFGEEGSEREELSFLLHGYLVELSEGKKVELVSLDPSYEGYTSVLLPLEESFFTSNYAEWLAGLSIHEADGDTLQKIKQWSDKGFVDGDFLDIIKDAEEKYLDLTLEVMDPVEQEVLIMYGPDENDPANNVPVDIVKTAELTEEEINEYLMLGYFREIQSLPGEIRFSLLPGAVNSINTDREYILVQSESDLAWVVTILKIVDGGGTIEEITKRIFESISWLWVTTTAGEHGFLPGSPIINAGKEDIIGSWDGISDIRIAICEMAIDCVGKVPYVWGGFAKGPGWDGISNGLDCSHFIDWIFWTVTGDNLGNTSTMGMGRYMHQIGEAELLPGDLAFTRPPGSASSKNDSNHVLIFVGRNHVGEKIYVDARSQKSGVCMSTYPEAVYYYRPYCLDGY